MPSHNSSTSFFLGRQLSVDTARGFGIAGGQVLVADSVRQPDPLAAVVIGGVSDPENDQITLTVTAVTQDGPVQGLDEGDTSPDAVLQEDKVLLRAERS